MTALPGYRLVGESYELATAFPPASPAPSPFPNPLEFDPAALLD